MLVVREVFTAKPGQASKLAGLFKDVMASIPGIRFRVLTDFIGQFNTVVLENDVDDLDQFEKMMADYASRADIRERMKGYTDMYLTGRREVFKVL
jgi:hypothetical protein